MDHSPFFEEPTDEEINAFLDGELAAASDRDTDAEATTEEPEESAEDDLDSDDLAEDEESDEEAADDDDGEDEDGDGDEEDEDDALPDPRELQRQLQELQTQREQERAQVQQTLSTLTAERQRVATAETLLEIKDRLTASEWQQLSTQLTEGYKDHTIRSLQAQIAERDQAEQEQQFLAAENDALEQIITQLGKELHSPLSDLEQTVLRQSADAGQLDQNIRTIVAHRRQMTEPARRAKAQQRRDRGADRSGVRSSGGARPPAKDYDNYDPSQFDRYVDDVLAG